MKGQSNRNAFEYALIKEMDAREELDTFLKTLPITPEQRDLLYVRINNLNERACEYSVALAKFDKKDA